MAIDEYGNYYVYREYAEGDKPIGVGAAEILELSEGEKIEYTLAPSDIWARNQESGKNKSELFREAGLTLTRANNDREAGWLAIKEILAVKNGDSRFKIFSNCVKLVEHLPALQRDAKRPTDCMTEPHSITHLPDALRYFALSYTHPAKEPKKELSPIAKHHERLAKAMKHQKYFY